MESADNKSTDIRYNKTVLGIADCAALASEIAAASLISPAFFFAIPVHYADIQLRNLSKGIDINSEYKGSTFSRYVCRRGHDLVQYIKNKLEPLSG